MHPSEPTISSTEKENEAQSSVPRDTGGYCTPAISMPSESSLLSHSREHLKASGAEDKGSGTHFLCLVVREVGPGLEIREGAPSSPLLPPFQHPTCLLCSIQPASLLASNLPPVQHPTPSLRSLQAGTKWQMVHIFPSIL